MNRRFWATVDWLLPLGFREADPERRARGRLLAAFCILTAIAGAGMAPLDAIFGTANPVVTLSATLLALLLVLGLRLTGRVDVIATLFVLAIAFLGSAMNAIEPLPGAPYKAWVLVLGFAPLVGPSVPVTLLIVSVALVLCFVIPAPPGSTVDLVPPGDLFFMVLAAWLGMVFVIDSHKMALAEHAAGLDAQRAKERAIDAASHEIEAEAKGTLSFLTTVSHELRTPLNGVLGLTSLLADEDIPDGARADVVEIQRSARSVLRVFDTLLYLTRLTAVGAKDIQPTDLPALVDAAVTLASDEVAPGEGVRWQIAPDLPRVVHIDAPTLRVILYQVLGSALEAGVRGLEIDIKGLGRELVLVIRGGPPGADRGAPLDLALALVAELVQGHEGHMTSERAGRFALTLTFPCRPVALEGPGDGFTRWERDATMA